MSIYVFKTSVTPTKMTLAENLLQALLPKVKWNFDLEDCDNILRIESKTDVSKMVCQHLQQQGFYCEELE